MISRTRNLAILCILAVLLAGAVGVIASKPTRLGLDLKGGTELVYQGRPTPKVPKVTPQAIDDALQTIRKRTDALGVSEPEIQRAGPDQISIGLPDVKNAQRAKEQVGTTAQLQFYDWEPNVLGPRGPNSPYAGSKALFQAVEVASKSKPRAEATDIPPGGPSPEIQKRFGNDKQKIEQYYDRTNDSAKDKFYLFGADQKLIHGPDTSCKELLSDYTPKGGTAPASRYAKDTQCSAELRALGSGGPPAGSRILKVPQGIVVVEAEKASKNQPASVKRYFVLEDDSELSGSDIKNP